MESGNHSDLLQVNGVFAHMWAEQIKADHSNELINLEESIKPDAGYVIPDPLEQVQKSTEAPADPEAFVVPPTTEQTEVPAFTLEQSQDQPVEDSATLESRAAELNPQESDAPRASEASETPEEANRGPTTGGSPYGAAAPSLPVSTEVPVVSPFSSPIAFPISDDASSMKVTDSPAPEVSQLLAQEPETASISPAQSPGIKFAQTESPRTGTPEPVDEGKRKRISSPNIQKIARRISLGGKKGGQQAADAARAVARALTGGGGEGGSRPESPTPKETLATRMGFKRVGSRDDGSQRGGSARDSGSFEADDASVSSPERSKSRKNKNKGKK